MSTLRSGRVIASRAERFEDLASSLAAAANG
jgi:hypothetical protein